MSEPLRRPVEIGEENAFNDLNISGIFMASEREKRARKIIKTNIGGAELFIALACVSA